MISCDECQKKIVAVFDNEANKGDEELIGVHLKDCPECRAFQGDMVRIRHQFVSVPMPSLSPAVGQELMQVAQTDSLRSKSLGCDESGKRQPLLLRFPRLTWAAGLAGVFLIVISWLACFNLARKVKVLRQELQTARRDIAVAQAEQQLKEDRERQQKAISALYFRMQELEDQVNQFSSPRTNFLPTQLNGLSDRRSGL
ncbi:MAG: zf-HC2 domain-containing protein [Phycisphaerales bacterium]|jgi:hypothetical protein